MAEMPESEFPMPVAVTRHLSECLSSLEVGLTSLGQPRLSEAAQPYPRQRSGTQRETGDRMFFT
jgi:hypothetical protein